ncbi:MAG: extracellular solute-binding protein [Oscillospiraceae bacterium]|nr:extracellular solute-binding protein [Oscillospiraceae bacterium]
MKIIKKVLLVLITVLMILTAASCSNKNNTNTDGTTENLNTADTAGNETAAVETTTAVKDSLPDNIDYGGYNFRIYVRDRELNNKDFYIESETGDVLNDAVYNRNKKVEERFNVNFTFKFYPYDDWSVTDIAKSIKSGDDAFDMAAIHGATVCVLSQADLLVDWHENMPYVDLTAPWWPDGIINNLSPFGKLYGATGDISYTYLDYAGCMLFNKDLFKNLGIDYPYADVANGTWTMDKFISIVKQGTSDLNGDGTITPDADRYGLDIYNAWAYPNDVFYCGGDRIISMGDDGVPALTMFSERTVSIYDKFFDMMNSGAAHVNELDATDIPFKDGRSLFLSGTLDSITEYRALDFDLGILPQPKYDETTSKYYVEVNQNTSMIVVPVTASDTQRTSMIVEALASEGYNTVIPSFYEISLKTKQARDDESAAMLDYIRAGVTCDYGMFDVSLVGNLLNFGAQLVQSSGTSFTSMYDKNKDAVENNIEKLKAKYGY